MQNSTTSSFVDQIKDQNRLAEEQAVLDNHEDKVEVLMERLKDLVVTTEPVMPGMDDHRPVVKLIFVTEHLSRRLNQVHTLMNIKRIGEDKELDICMLELHEKRLKSINTNLRE